jgi:hypothetical protein
LENQWFAKSAPSKNGVLTQSGAALGATPIEPQRHNSHIALQACLEAALIEPTNDVGLVVVFGT